jgi:hypothetical protein
VLKFFRKYNKWILGIGGSLLMIVFLIQPVMSMFEADRMAIPIGTIEGGELVRGDVIAASSDLNLLRRFGLFLDRDPNEDSRNNDSLRWALILKDSQALGLSASQREVDLLKFEIGQSDADIELIASRINATPAYVRQAMRHWLVVQKYKELMAGQTHLSGQSRARLMRVAGSSSDPQTYRLYEEMAYGTSRLSKPIVEHFLQDQGAQVSGQVVVIRAQQLLADTPTPSDEEVESLYEQFKDALPGRGDPYGFGYRVPDRVKIEYLSIPMDQARQHVKVSEADALAHYRNYPERFGGAAATDQADAVDAKPYEQVRDDVIEDVTTLRAFELVEKMAKSAYGLFYEDTRGMDKQDDYRVIQDMSALTSMRVVADRLEAEFGLLPSVHTAERGWVNAEDLTGLPGIGFGRLADNLRVDFTSFVLSAKELEPLSDNPLLPRRLQAGLAGSPIMGADGSRYIFRLTDAQATHLPESLDAVIEPVTQDAHLLGAYQKLLAESDGWQGQAAEEGIEAVATRADTVVIPLPPTPRRVPLANGLLSAPLLPAVGQSESFVEAFFNTANGAREHGGVEDASADKVTGTVGVDSLLALAVYRVDSYQPLTREEYNEDANNPLLPMMIDATVLAQARVENPLSLQALSYRLNYLDEFADEDEEAEAAGGADQADEVGEVESSGAGS